VNSKHPEYASAVYRVYSPNRKFCLRSLVNGDGKKTELLVNRTVANKEAGFGMEAEIPRDNMEAMDFDVLSPIHQT
jgi:hypothetical protein